MNLCNETNRKPIYNRIFTTITLKNPINQQESATYKQDSVTFPNTITCREVSCGYAHYNEILTISQVKKNQNKMWPLKSKNSLESFVAWLLVTWNQWIGCLCCHDRRNPYVLCRNWLSAAGVASVRLIGACTGGGAEGRATRRVLGRRGVWGAIDSTSGRRSTQ